MTLLCLCAWSSELSYRSLTRFLTASCEPEIWNKSIWNLCLSNERTLQNYFVKPIFSKTKYLKLNFHTTVWCNQAQVFFDTYRPTFVGRLRMTPCAFHPCFLYQKMGNYEVSRVWLPMTLSTPEALNTKDNRKGQPSSLKQKIWNILSSISWVCCQGP